MIRLTRPKWQCTARVAACLYVTICWLQTSVTHASPSTDAGVQWLGANQKAEGYWVGSAGGTAVRDTSAAANALRSLSPGSAAYSQAVVWLGGTMPSVTDYLARKIYTLSGASMDVSSSVTALVAAQHTDGGFGLDPDHESNPLDTALALEALAAANYTSGQFVASAVGYLLNSQQANGGWLDGANSTSVPLTAQALRALLPYRNTYSGVTAALTAGQNYLLSQRNASGLWGEPFETALALTALIPNTTDLTLIDSSVSGLAGSQFANGSWNDDAYTTALALSALRAYEVRRAGTTPTASAALSGYVVRAGSTEPISGAQVTVAERSGVSVLTNSDGYFLIPNLLLGPWASDNWRTLLSVAMAKVAPVVWRARLRAVLSVDVVSRLGAVAVPVLYLRGRNDLVVRRSAWKQVEQALPSARLVELEGPHLLLQAKPVESAAKVTAFARELGFTL